MGTTPKEEGRTPSKAQKRKAQRRPATRGAAAAAAGDRRSTAAKRRQSKREELVALDLSSTPKKRARVRGRSSYRSLKPEAAGRGR